MAKTRMQRETRPSVIGAAAALALAVGAGLLWAVADAVWYGVPGSDGPGIALLYIGAWALLAWAVIVAVVVIVHLIRVVLAGRRPGIPEIVLVASALIVVAVVVLGQPWTGSGTA